MNAPTKPRKAPAPRIIARIVKPAENAKQPAQPISSVWSLVGRQKNPSTGKLELIECVTVRTYWNPRADGMAALRACIWARSPQGSSEPWASGRGSASGCGYHKESSAIEDAIASAGIELYGDPYRRDPARNKTRLYFGGTGDHAYQEIFEAIARARGFRGPFLLVSH